MASDHLPLVANLRIGFNRESRGFAVGLTDSFARVRRRQQPAVGASACSLALRLQLSATCASSRCLGDASDRIDRHDIKVISL